MSLGIDCAKIEGILTLLGNKKLYHKNFKDKFSNYKKEDKISIKKGDFLILYNDFDNVITQCVNAFRAILFEVQKVKKMSDDKTNRYPSNKFSSKLTDSISSLQDSQTFNIEERKNEKPLKKNEKDTINFTTELDSEENVELDSEGLNDVLKAKSSYNNYIVAGQNNNKTNNEIEMEKGKTMYQNDKYEVRNRSYNPSSDKSKNKMNYSYERTGFNSNSTKNSVKPTKMKHIGEAYEPNNYDVYRNERTQNKSKDHIDNKYSSKSNNYPQTRINPQSDKQQEKPKMNSGKALSTKTTIKDLHELRNYDKEIIQAPIMNSERKTNFQEVQAYKQEYNETILTKAIEKSHSPQYYGIKSMKTEDVSKNSKPLSPYLFRDKEESSRIPHSSMEVTRYREKENKEITPGFYSNSNSANFYSASRENFRSKENERSESKDQISSLPPHPSNIIRHRYSNSTNNENNTLYVENDKDRVLSNQQEKKPNYEASKPYQNDVRGYYSGESFNMNYQVAGASSDKIRQDYGIHPRNKFEPQASGENTSRPTKDPIYSRQNILDEYKNLTKKQSEILNNPSESKLSNILIKGDYKIPDRQVSREETDLINKNRELEYLTKGSTHPIAMSNHYDKSYFSYSRPREDTFDANVTKKEYDNYDYYQRPKNTTPTYNADIRRENNHYQIQNNPNSLEFSNTDKTVDEIMNKYKKQNGEYSNETSSKLATKNYIGVVEKENTYSHKQYTYDLKRPLSNNANVIESNDRNYVSKNINPTEGSELENSLIKLIPMNTESSSNKKREYKTEDKDDNRQSQMNQYAYYQSNADRYNYDSMKSRYNY